MDKLKSIALLFALFSFSSLGLATDETDQLEFTRLDLSDGRRLKNVVVKSYDPSRTRFLIVAGGKAMLIPAELVPTVVADKLKLAAPRSGATMAVAPTQYVPLASNVPANGSRPSASSQSPIVRPNYSAPARPSSIAPTRILNEQRQAPQQEQLDLSHHRSVALERAQNYYRYEYPVGSSASRVQALNFETEFPEPITGWAGRYRTKGKALVQFFDSKGYSYGRTTSTYEVITEQKPGEYPKVVDFAIKS